MKKMLRYVLAIIIGLVVLSVGFVAIRQALGKAQIEREWQAIPAPLTSLQTTTRLEILPLYDRESGSANVEVGPGVSYLVRTDSTTVLMDLGHNPDASAQLPAIKNLEAQGVDWVDIDAVVFTHPHFDHVGGVQPWLNKTISFGDFGGDLSNMPIYVPIPMTYSGATLTYAAQPTLISGDVATTGVISYPEIFPLSVLDPVGHEQALVVNVAGKGPVLITGCGHPTLERLVSRVEAVFGQPVAGVVGGLHYQQAGSEALQPHIQFLQARQPGLVALSPHDSGPDAIAALQAAFPDAYHFVRVGEVIQFP